MARIEINQSAFAGDRRAAEENRMLLRERGWTAVNMIGSPGSGKTTLLLHALPRLNRPSAVVAGDVEGSFDAERLRAAGIAAAQIETHGSCHLTARLVREQLLGLALPAGALIVIENVGNLVCPAFFDLGENFTLAVLSAAEGHEKPLKYPAVFRRANAVAITKCELTGVCRFDTVAAKAAALLQNPESCVIELSAHEGIGMERFIGQLEIWK